jgi:glutathione S-transferase
LKLYWSPASPYARKVRMVIAERQLGALVEEITVATAEDPPELLAANPLGKIPALVTDEGFSLYDSPVISAYLDAHPKAEGPRLRPHSGAERWMVMRAEALGDGLMDLGLNLIGERRKPEGEKSPSSVKRWHSQLYRALDAVPEALRSLPAEFNLGHLALISALGYLDFRHDDLKWREGRDELASWFESVQSRPSVMATAPKG